MELKSGTGLIKAFTALVLSTGSVMSWCSTTLWSGRDFSECLEKHTLKKAKRLESVINLNKVVTAPKLL